MPDLNNLLAPKSIALIGASNTPGKVGNIVIQNLLQGFKGKIYPVNPKEKEISGLLCYQTITTIPEIPDLAIIAIPAEPALSVLEEIGQKGIKNVLIFSAGFKEMPGAGEENENKLQELAKKYSLNILGPNCLGFVNNSVSLNATFGKAPSLRGNIKILSQSGAIATSLFDWSQNHSLGIDQFITLGNKSILNENHFLEQWSNQEETENVAEGLSSLHPIGMYLESISDGKKLLEIAKTIKEPIFVLKPGKSPEAASAMKSHTGSLAGADDVLNAALTESNIIRAETLEEFFNLAKALSWENIPAGPNIAIISNAGGPGVISADAVSSTNLKLATLNEDAQKLLAEKLPRSASLHNPVDVLGDALSDRFGAALEVTLKQDDVHAVLVILTPQIMTQIKETAQIIGEKSNVYKKPIYCSFIGGSQVLEGERILNDLKIPNFNFPESAIKTLSLVYTWQKNKPKIQTDDLPKPYISPEIDVILKQPNSSKTLLDTNASSHLLGLLGLNQPSSIVTNNYLTAEKYAQEVGWPLVLKVANNTLHKSDSGGVAVDINSFQKLKEAWFKTQKSEHDSIQLQKQIKIDLELIVGFKRDSVFGDTFFFGAGGKLVNLFEDKNLSLFPLSKNKILNCIKNSKLFPVINGYRNSQKLDLNRLVEDIYILANLFQNTPKIKEMEINPVIMNSDGVFHVDPKILLND